MKELNFSFLLTVFKKHWWKIVAFTLVVMLGAALFTQFFIPKKYSSSVKFYVVNVNADQDYASANNLAAAEYLVNDYIEIINGDTLLTAVAEKLTEEGYSVNANALRSMIKSSVKAETSVFTITISHTDKALSYRVAQLLEEMAPPVVTKIAKPTDTTAKRATSNVRTVLNSMMSNGSKEQLKLTWIDPETGKTRTDVPTEAVIWDHLEEKGEFIEQQSCIAVLKTPVEATSHDSPNLIVNTMLAGVVAAVLSYAFFFVISSIASTIVTEDDIKNMIKKPVMAAIPHWEITEKK